MNIGHCKFTGLSKTVATFSPYLLPKQNPQKVPRIPLHPLYRQYDF